MNTAYTQARFLLLIALVGSGISMPAYAQQETAPLHIGLTVSLNKLICVVALEEGIYKKNGLDVDHFITPAAAEAAKQSGVQVPGEFVRRGDDPGYVAISGGLNMIVDRATDAQSKDHVIIATTENFAQWKIHSRTDISKPEQLKGKRLGYSGFGNVSHFVALVFTKRMGWDAEQDISLMSNALSVNVLRRRTVDAFLADALTSTMATAAGFPVLVDLGEWKIPIAGNGIHVDRAWLKENPETARRFVKSIVEAIAIMKKDKQVAFRAMAKWYGITDPKAQADFYRPVADLPRKPYPSVEGIRKTMEIYNRNEMRRYKPEDFYDESIVGELDKSGFIDELY
jgi:NitT/TauT family transport system substrate-binding protein